jgi:hypothetical protein
VLATWSCPELCKGTPQESQNWQQKLITRWSDTRQLLGTRRCPWQLWHEMEGMLCYTHPKKKTLIPWWYLAELCEKFCRTCHSYIRVNQDDSEEISLPLFMFFRGKELTLAAVISGCTICCDFVALSILIRIMIAINSLGKGCRRESGSWEQGANRWKILHPTHKKERHHQITTTSAVHDVPQNAIKLQVRSQCVFSRLQVLWTSVGWEIPEASTDEFSGWLRGPCQQCSSRINLNLMVDHHFPAMQWGKGSFRQFWVSLYLYAICKFPYQWDRSAVQLRSLSPSRRLRQVLRSHSLPPHFFFLGSITGGSFDGGWCGESHIPNQCKLWSSVILKWIEIGGK